MYLRSARRLESFFGLNGLGALYLIFKPIVRLSDVFTPFLPIIMDLNFSFQTCLKNITFGLSCTF